MAPKIQLDCNNNDPNFDPVQVDPPKPVELSRRVEPPAGKPPFTLKDLRDSIPPHCFHRSLARSMSYVCRDLVILLFNILLATHIQKLGWTGQLLLWPVFFTLQAGLFGGIFVLGHDCVHDAFSPYPFINDLMGMILNGVILVPYLGFKYSHMKHHRYTANYEHDNAHVPPMKRTVKREEGILKNLRSNFIWQLISMAHRFTAFSLYYIYVMWFDSVQLVGKKATHLSQHSSKFKNWRDFFITLLADLIFLKSLVLLMYFCVSWGIGFVFMCWILPLAIFWASLGFVTFLQHTDTYVPWYREPEWCWMQGALSTVDRTLGLVLDFLTHDVAKYHAIHHLFPQIPFYNGPEATEGVKPILKNYYLRDDTNFLLSLHRAFVHCKIVDETKGRAFMEKFI